MKNLSKRNIIVIVAIAILLAFAYLLISVRSGIARSVDALTDPDVIWQGDAETGDFSQWCNAHQATADRISVVASPVAQGSYAYKFVMVNGDSVFGAERVVLNQANPECPNTQWETGERYYSWSVLLPPDYPTNTSWSLVAQWKGVHSGSPPVQLGLANDKWRLFYRPNTSSPNLLKWETPVIKGQWESFVMHVNWSTDNTGFIELWKDGVLVVPKFNTPTLHVSNGIPVNTFVEIGLYRDSGISSNIVLYHDGMIVGKTFLSVTGGQSPTEAPPTITDTPTDTPTATNPPPTATFTPTTTMTPTATNTPTSTATTIIPTPTFWCPIDPAGVIEICVRPK